MQRARLRLRLQLQNCKETGLRPGYRYEWISISKNGGRAEIPLCFFQLSSFRPWLLITLDQLVVKIVSCRVVCLAPNDLIILVGWARWDWMGWRVFIVGSAVIKIVETRGM